MQINIQTKGFSLTNALARYVERRFNSAASTNKRHILRTNVRLMDINGPRGGIDKRCQFNVAVAGIPEVVIEETSANMYAAIDRAAHGAGRIIVKRLRRLKSHKLSTRMRKSLASTKHSFAV